MCCKRWWMEFMIGFCLRTTFSLYSVRSARFQTACSLGYYTVFSDSKKRPLERHNSLVDCQCSATLSAKRSKGPARQNQEAWSPCTPVCGGLTPGRAPAPARGVERRAASHVSIGNRNQQSNRSRLHLRRSKTKPSTRQKLAGYPRLCTSVPVYTY